MKRSLPIVLAFVVMGCGFQIPPCILDGSCLPKPSPSPSASPVSSPSPTAPPSVSPSPEPSASPSPVPTPVPTPSATPTPAPSPSPSAQPTPSPSPVAELCPKPIRTKIALFSKRKLEESRHTWRNVWNVTPIVPSTGHGGSCEWKRNQESGELPSECEAANSCSAVYAVTFAPIDPAVGIPQAYQAGKNKDGSSFGHDPVERSSTSDYLLVITDAGQGPAKLCASFPNLDTWRCTQFFVDSEGEAVGAEGNDSTKSFSEPK